MYSSVDVWKSVHLIDSNLRHWLVLEYVYGCRYIYFIFIIQFHLYTDIYIRRPYKVTFVWACVYVGGLISNLAYLVI